MTSPSLRPTRRGWGAALLAFVLTDLGALGGNNLVVLVASVAWAALVVDAVLGRLNLRSLAVERTLPTELYARTSCRGAFRVSGGGRVAARQLQVDDGVASARIEIVLPGRTVDVTAWWRLSSRGPDRLEGVRVRSGFPFGLFDHAVWLGREVDVLVFPFPLNGRSRQARRPAVEGDESPFREGAGDLRDLRPYRVGDRLRAIHWPTSARVGRPMVGVRSAEEDAGVVVELPAEPDERALEEATGAVLEAFDQGIPVGVRGLDARLAAPRSGIRWRRRLLDAVALVGYAS